MVQLFFKIVLKHFIFDKLSDKKKNLLKIALQVSKIAFSPMVIASSDLIIVQLRIFHFF